MTYPGPPLAMLETFIDYYGPMITAFEHAERSGTAPALKAELADLFEQQNKSDSADRTAVDATFLRVTVSVRSVAP